LFRFDEPTGRILGNWIIMKRTVTERPVVIGTTSRLAETGIVEAQLIAISKRKGSQSWRVASKSPLPAEVRPITLPESSRWNAIQTLKAAK
jgi:hypothetical protein